MECFTLYIWGEVSVRLLTGFLCCLSVRGQGFRIDRVVYTQLRTFKEAPTIVRWHLGCTVDRRGLLPVICIWLHPVSSAVSQKRNFLLQNHVKQSVFKLQLSPLIME